MEPKSFGDVQRISGECFHFENKVVPEHHSHVADDEEEEDEDDEDHHHHYRMMAIMDTMMTITFGRKRCS